MKILANREIRGLFRNLSLLWAAAFGLSEWGLWLADRRLSWWLAVLFLLAGGGIWAICLGYFRRQDRILEQAVGQINAYLDGDSTARIECDQEGEWYRLFHSINSLAAVLNAHADRELREKEFLKNTISDISHQLKTPLAALNIYNGLLQAEDVDASAVQEFARLSEGELDRMEALVQSLLKIARLDAGTLVPEIHRENLADRMAELRAQFACRAGQEGKKLIASGPEAAFLDCDWGWLGEALGNLVKNALDHTKPGDTVCLEWEARPAWVQIAVRDNGSGIHPEDMPYLFKRFYRSRFSQDTQGIGLGLPLAKAMIEAQGGTLQADSRLGQGTAFTVRFLFLAKL